MLFVTVGLQIKLTRQELAVPMMSVRHTEHSHIKEGEVRTATIY